MDAPGDRLVGWVTVWSVKAPCHCVASHGCWRGAERRVPAGCCLTSHGTGVPDDLS
nr:MAG TPA: hypothetical protein [Caudoviricetes sp.]